MTASVRSSYTTDDRRTNSRLQERIGYGASDNRLSFRASFFSWNTSLESLQRLRIPGTQAEGVPHFKNELLISQIVAKFNEAINERLS